MEKYGLETRRAAKRFAELMFTELAIVHHIAMIGLDGKKDADLKPWADRLTEIGNTQVKVAYSDPVLTQMVNGNTKELSAEAAELFKLTEDEQRAISNEFCGTQYLLEEIIKEAQSRHGSTGNGTQG